MRPIFQWKLRGRVLELGRRTLVMGILNITLDSFSDGGRFFSHDAAIERALGMLEEGADIIDIGGESTRPGAAVARAGAKSRPVSSAVSAEEELRRVVPVIREVIRAVPDAVISVDTYKSEVARQAVEAGARIVNDVSAFRWDPPMAQAVARLGCGAILMHTRGCPEEWRELPSLDSNDMLELVSRELREWAAAAEQQGVRHDQMVLDPGFGFGKNFRDNYPLLARLAELHLLGYPLLSATSRKSFIGRTVGRGGETAPPTQRLYGTLATVTASVLAGAHIVRVHDVTPAIETCAVADEILKAQAVN